MFEKFSANRIRYYTSKVRLRGLTQPRSLGFVCVAAISNRQGTSKLHKQSPPARTNTTQVAGFCLCSRDF
ncbi:MAG: hypothetical protein ACFKPT_10780 [Gloeotrichia echinulata GP01]